MATERITELTAATVVDEDNDAVIVVDVSDTDQSTSGTTKKASPKVLRGGKSLPSGDFVGTSDTQTLTNKTLTSPKINEDVAVTASASEINKLDGVTASTDELNILDGVTADKDEINVLDGISASTEDLNKTDDVGGDIVGTTEEQTLTNKTLTTPTLTNPTITFTDKAVDQNVLCRAYLSSAQNNLVNGTATLVNLDAETYDIGGDFNTTTHLFTAPVTGYYLINTCVGFTNLVVDKRYWSIIVKNSTNLSYSSSIASADQNLYVQNMTIQYLSAGNTVGLQARSDSGGDTVDLFAYTEGTFMEIILLSV